MSEQKKPLSQKDRKARFKQNNPEAESRQKEKERQRENLIRFHVIRNHRYGYGFPTEINQESDIFKRVREQYLSEASQPVEVMEVMS